jgi:hypothetical protein
VAHGVLLETLRGILSPIDLHSYTKLPGFFSRRQAPEFFRGPGFLFGLRNQGLEDQQQAASSL